MNDNRFKLPEERYYSPVRVIVNAMIVVATIVSLIKWLLL